MFIPVIASNHKTGYAYAAQLSPHPHFRSPTDTLTWRKKHAGQERTVPVYLSDGRTVIGKFVISSGTSRTVAEPSKSP